MRGFRGKQTSTFAQLAKKVVKLCLLGLIGLLLIVAGLQAVLYYAQGGRMLSIQTKSMVPYLQKGELVEVVRVPAKTLKVGDVITYVSPVDNRITLTHRIIALPNDSNHHKFITKGDANHAPDAPVDALLIVGRLQYHVPYLGFGVNWLHTILGIAIIIYIPALVIIWSELKRLTDYFKSIAPYIESTYAASFKKIPRKYFNFSRVVALILCIIGLGMIGIGPVYAAMTGTAALTNTSISTIHVPKQNTPLLIWSFYIRCSDQNTIDATYSARVTIYNPTDLRTDLIGWRISTNAGTDYVQTASLVVYERRYVVIDISIPSGLKYQGDHLSLLAPNGENVDGLSWGSDVSQFTPALEILTADTKLDRVPRSQDTNTTADWQAITAACLR